MISFESAYKTVMETAPAVISEPVPLAASLNRVLAQDVVSDIDMPPFNKSAMDGYACRRKDLKKPLTLVENIPAGYCPEKVLGPNECAKIMTGAIVPEGADCVIMVEHTEALPNATVRFLKDDTKTNICYQGEDIKMDDVVLEKGTRILPQHIAVLATAGYAKPLVAKKPRVGIIATGSELVDPSEPATGAKIRNSNGWQLAAQAERMGAEVNNYGIAVDTEEALNTAIQKAMAENDVILLSGGVSMGDYDLVPAILKQNGIELLFDRVAIKPGKPSTFGISDGVRCFALPGNPVSTFVQFEILAKPFLFRMMGHEFCPTTVTAELTGNLPQGNSDRKSIIPVRFTAPNKITIVDYHGSAHINAMCSADGFITLPKTETIMKKGEKIDVRLFE